jgi:hypothetical protein
MGTILTLSPHTRHLYKILLLDVFTRRGSCLMSLSMTQLIACTVRRAPSSTSRDRVTTPSHERVLTPIALYSFNHHIYPLDSLPLSDMQICPERSKLADVINLALSSKVGSHHKALACNTIIPHPASFLAPTVSPVPV